MNSAPSWRMFWAPEKRSPILKISAARKLDARNTARPPQISRSKARSPRPRDGGFSAWRGSSVTGLLRRRWGPGAGLQRHALGGDGVQRPSGGSNLARVVALFGVEPDLGRLHLAHGQQEAVIGGTEAADI